MELRQLLKDADIPFQEYEGNCDISAIVSDSRNACKNCMFVCIRGLNRDGHQFAHDAVSAGAAVIVVEQNAELYGIDTAVVITVPNTRQALAHLFNAWYGLPSEKMKFIAVTGTNGKTSVTYFLKRIFELALYRCGLVGTVSCLSLNRRLISDNEGKLRNMTTPDPEQLYGMLAQMADDGVEYVFMEASSHALALDKLSPILFRAAIFTNLTQDHLDFHGSMRNYLSAKLKLLKKSELAIVNQDSPYYNDIKGSCAGKTVGCSIEADNADYRAVSIKNNGVDGIEYSVRSSNAMIKIRCMIPGNYTVMNTLEACACALELGIRPAVVAQAIASISGIDGRLEKIKLGNDADFSVFIDYAHTPDAMENLLRTARAFCSEGQYIKILFGCGGDRDKSKRPVMGEIATRLADFAVITSDNCRCEPPDQIIKDILEGVQGRDNYKVILSRKQAIEDIIFNADAGDVILLAGKGHEQYEINGDRRTPFSEKDIVLSAVEKRRNVNR